MYDPNEPLEDDFKYLMLPAAIDDIDFEEIGISTSQNTLERRSRLKSLSTQSCIPPSLISELNSYKSFEKDLENKKIIFELLRNN